MEQFSVKSCVYDHEPRHSNIPASIPQRSSDFLPWRTRTGSKINLRKYSGSNVSHLLVKDDSDEPWKRHHGWIGFKTNDGPYSATEVDDAVLLLEKRDKRVYMPRSCTSREAAYGPYTEKLYITCWSYNDRARLIESLTRRGFLCGPALSFGNVTQSLSSLPEGTSCRSISGGMHAAASSAGSHGDGGSSAVVSDVQANARGSGSHESEPDSKRRKIESHPLVLALQQEKKRLEEEVNEKRAQIAKLIRICERHL